MFLARNFQHREVFISRALNILQAKQCHWCPDYKPGPYPKTQKEREEAAKKYNLLPEEYEPYPDDGSGAGDYPKLPYESVDARDPYYPWDQPELRRDYLEPVHKQINILVPEAITTVPEKIPYSKQLCMYLGALTTCFLIYKVLIKYTINIPVLERQYPTAGVKHYTFELDYSK